MQVSEAASGPKIERGTNKGRTLSGLVRDGFEVCSGSAVDFAAMLDAGDFDGIAEVMEAGAVVTDAEAELGRFNVLEALHIALAGVDELGQGVEDAQGGVLVDGA
jgi:hypothetical protein